MKKRVSMKKQRCVFVTKFVCGLLAVALGTALVSCHDDDEPYQPANPNTDNATGVLDGLWVEQVKSGVTIVPHIDIKGDKVVLCRSNPFMCDYSDRVAGTLAYNAATKEGVISFSDGTTLKVLCDEHGMLCSSDTIPYYKINNTLDSLQAMRVNPGMTMLKDYIGPDHDLGINLSRKALMGNANFAAGSAWYIDMLKFAGQSIAKGALSWAGGAIMEEIFSCFYTDPTSEKLETIISQIGEINAKLYEIEKLIKMENYELYINQRTNDYCNPLSNYSKRYADALVRVNKEDSAAIAEIVNHWHDDLPVISGRLGGPMEAAANYMDFLMTTMVEQTDMYSIYDIYTFNCVPWAHEGYDFRQSLRASDLALITSNLNMAILYAKIHNWDKNPIYKQYIIDLCDKMQKFMAFCESKPVEISDKLVCQIKDAHFVMDKEIIMRDYNLPDGMTWYGPGCQFIHGENETSDLIYYGGMDMSIEQFRQKQIKPEEIRAISKYFDQSLTLSEIFKSAGVNCPATLLLLCDKTSSDYSGNLYVSTAALNQTGSYREPKYSDWLKAETHWSITFRYWFDGWNITPGYYWVDAVATNVLYRY